jgi:hypothetical protein
MEKLLIYNIIGIGEFSHGIMESWQFRFNLLKYAIKNTNKKIVIFNEMSIWQAENIMNNTIWSNEDKKFIKHNKIKLEQPIQNDNYVGGKLWQYIGHSMESKIFLKIIKYIRQNKDRITIIGIDNDKIDRDYDMYKIIMKYFNKNNINFVWAHNNHIADLPLNDDSLKYIKNKNHKWFCGHYLKKKFKEDYCIILSQAYEGENRFNGYCIGENCNERTMQLNYFYKKFKYNKNKKYVDTNKKYILLTDYNEPLISFSNSYYKGNKYGVQDYTDTNIFNYILFWNKVNKLI